MRVPRKVNYTLGLALVGALLTLQASAQNPDTREQSVLRQANQAWQHRMRTLSSVTGRSDSLAEYARKCDEATGITVPEFSCDAGTEVPGEGTVPAYRGAKCDNPNVLNGQCDPGSRFQVLPGGSADAVAVAHCRKDGNEIAGSEYGDIAIIQYNKRNGAVCFYQALDGLPGRRVPPPRAGEGPWDPAAPAGHQGAWFSPSRTEGIGCTGCHDSGGFIRSRYLAQLTQLPHAMPSIAAGFDNFSIPLKYVGLDFDGNRSWRIDAPRAPEDRGRACNSCHRLAVSNHPNGGRVLGTAAYFSLLATADSQKSKNPHSATSPIWMRPGQVTFDAGAAASAKKYQECALGFVNSGYSAAPPGCTATPLGEPWAAKVEPVVSLAPVYYLLLH